MSISYFCRQTMLVFPISVFQGQLLPCHTNNANGFKFSKMSGSFQSILKMVPKVFKLSQMISNFPKVVLIGPKSCQNIPIFQMVLRGAIKKQEKVGLCHVTGGGVFANLTFQLKFSYLFFADQLYCLRDTTISSLFQKMNTI